GVVERPQVALPGPRRRKNSSPGFVCAWHRYLRQTLFQLTDQAIDVHQNGRVAEVWAGLRHGTNTDNARTGRAPCRPAYPEAGASIGDTHLVDVLIGAVSPVVAAHLVKSSSCFRCRVVPHSIGKSRYIDTWESKRRLSA